MNKVKFGENGLEKVFILIIQLKNICLALKMSVAIFTEITSCLNVFNNHIIFEDRHVLLKVEKLKQGFKKKKGVWVCRWTIHDLSKKHQRVLEKSSKFEMV